MMRYIRDKNATCATCAYAAPAHSPKFIICRSLAPSRERADATTTVPESYWCGEHPDLLILEKNP
jgi:hypothetical protein